ncbi:hypothetical protein [Levilactobacillus fujinensis]
MGKSWELNGVTCENISNEDAEVQSNFRLMAMTDYKGVLQSEITVQAKF